LKGNVARAVLYMDVRYEGGVHGVTGVAEEALRLTANIGQIPTTAGNARVALAQSAFKPRGNLSAKKPADD
ncbi:MAG: endonuclease I, partial [Verrucomicrobiota bacterium]